MANPRIKISIRGGLVTAITSDQKVDVDVDVLDYDINPDPQPQAWVVEQEKRSFKIIQRRDAWQIYETRVNALTPEHALMLARNGMCKWIEGGVEELDARQMEVQDEDGNPLLQDELK